MPCRFTHLLALVLASGFGLEAAAAQAPGPVESSSSSLDIEEVLDALSSVGRSLTSSTATSALSVEGREVLGGLRDVRPPPPPPPDEVELSLIYSGGSGGISLERYSFDLVAELESALGNVGQIEDARIFHGVLVQGGFTLLTPDRSVRSVVDFLDGSKIECGPDLGAWSVRSRSTRLLFRLEGLAPKLDALPDWLREISRARPHRPFALRYCWNDRGREAILYSPPDEVFVPPQWDLARFEFRRGIAVQLNYEGVPASVDLIGIPSNEGARRFRLLDLLTQDRQRSLFVDTGSFVDGSARIGDSLLSDQRPLAYEMLDRLGPAALVPGPTELVAGPLRFQKELMGRALPYVATNWRAASPELRLPSFRLHQVVLPGGPLQIAFLGVIDPAILERAPALVESGVTLVDPVQAIEEELRGLALLPVPPDLIVVLTHASPPLLLRLRQELTGIDLLIGDSFGLSAGLDGLEVDLGPEGPRTVSPLTLPLQDLSRAELSFRRTEGRLRLVGVRVRFLATTEDLQPDERVVEVLTRSRARVLPRLDEALLAPKLGAPLDGLTNEEWRRLVCEVVRRRTSADVVLLPSLPEIDWLPGPLTEVVVADRLAVLDRLVKDELDGVELGPILEKAKAPAIATACGAELGTASPYVRGTRLDKARSYRVVTTDRALMLGLSDAFSRVRGRRIFGAGPEPVLSEKGRPLSLKKAVLDQLRDERDTHGLVAVEPFLADSAKAPVSFWSLVFERVALQFESFEGADDPAFAAVSETLATNPSSSSLGIAVDANGLYAGSLVAADLRLRARYHTLFLTNADDQELEDDLRVSASGSFPALAFAPQIFSPRPYLEVLFDSEFTPIVGEAGELPRQADLSLILGLAATPTGFRRFRLGGFALRDLSRLDRPTQFGARADALLSLDLLDPLRFTSDLEAIWFWPNAADDATQLRFKVRLENRLAVPLAHNLDVGAFLQIFGFQGRVESNDQVRASTTYGLSLEARGSFPFEL